MHERNQDRSGVPERPPIDVAIQKAELGPREAALRRENDALWTRLRQLEARYERLLHTWERQTQEERTRVTAELLTAFLPTLDSLELALEMIPAPSPLRDGLEITCHELARRLSAFGLAIHSPHLGAPFDPHVQEAVSYEPIEGFQEGTVARVLRNGYSVDGRLLRPALVTVAR